MRLGRTLTEKAPKPRNSTRWPAASALLMESSTVVTMRSLHPTKELRAVKIGFGAVELGYQTLDKLAEHLRSQT